MAESPRQGVVDRHCRVHDTDNLNVASSAFFPVSGAANLTLMITAIALRLADNIAKRLSNNSSHPISADA